MDLFYLMMIALTAAGVVFLVAPVFVGRGKAKEDAAFMDYMTASAAKSVGKGSVTPPADVGGTLRESLQEADEVINEIHDVSGSVLKEIDNKYQELLFLYNLIEDKRRAIESDNEDGSGGRKPFDVIINDETDREAEYKRAINSRSAPRRVVDVNVGEAHERLFKHPKLAEIKELKASGATNAEIARRLSVGQGEVALILEMASR